MDYACASASYQCEEIANQLMMLNKKTKFLKTLKFSHYPALKQNIRKNSYMDKHNGIEYNFSIYSNDIIKLKLISYIITEKGDLSLDQIPSIRKQILLDY